jgi:hypothetical protein
MDQAIIKTRQQWGESHQNLGEFLKVGDPVDNDFIDWARDIMPPAHWTSRIIQIGEAHSHIEGRATYTLPPPEASMKEDKANLTASTCLRRQRGS